MQKRSLPTTMNVYHRRQLLLRNLRKTIDRRHTRRLAFEGADQIPHMPKHSAVLLPLANHLSFERILARIKISPQLVNRLRDSFGSKEGMQIQERKRSDGSSLQKGAASCGHIVRRSGSNGGRGKGGVSLLRLRQFDLKTATES